MKLFKGPWFTYDKPFHAWLHSMVARALRTYTAFSLEKIIFILVVGGIIYEICDLTYHCVIIEEVAFKEYLKDSLRDLVWNIIGMTTGLIT